MKALKWAFTMLLPMMMGIVIADVLWQMFERSKIFTCMGLPQ